MKCMLKELLKSTIGRAAIVFFAFFWQQYYSNGLISIARGESARMTPVIGAANLKPTTSTAAPDGVAAAASVFGIDLSWYDGTIDWPSMNAAIQFAYLSATQSTYIPDPEFAVNVAGASGQHIAIGAYHTGTPLFSLPYYQPSYDRITTPESEADNFLATAGSEVGVGFLPPALDIESQVVTWALVNGEYQASVWVDPLTGASWDSSLKPLPSQPAMGAAALAQWINRWVAVVYQQTNVMPILYCDLTYAAALYPYLATTIKLWIADPGQTAGSPTTVGQPAWYWSFDQYSWTGSVANTSPIDLDTFNGDQAAFNALLNGTTTEPIALSVAGSGYGTVTSSPGGINCVSNCSANYTSGASVTLSAGAETNSTFVGWSGDCTGLGSCSLNMDGAKNVTATFTADRFLPRYPMPIRHSVPNEN